jgi:SAM-dependent methyltransferase
MYQIIDFTHKLLSEHLKKGDVVVDATCGNGNDTLFLVQTVGPEGKVYAFDIQEEAIRNTQNLCKEFHNITYFLESHEKITELITEPIKGAIFNLGYLPKGDKGITTKALSTLKAIDSLKEQVIYGDLMIAVVIYPGHDEGQIESHAIEQFVRLLDKHEYLVIKYENINRSKSPYLIAICKNKY